jgi:hypothetical protein
MTKITITLAEQIAEIRAELGMRVNVYRKLIRDGRMKQETADRKFASMRAGLHVLMELKEDGIKQGGRPDLLDRDRIEEGLPQ